MVTTSCCWVVVVERVHGYSSIRCDMLDKGCGRRSSWITPSEVGRCVFLGFEYLGY